MTSLLRTRVQQFIVALEQDRLATVAEYGYGKLTEGRAGYYLEFEDPLKGHQYLEFETIQAFHAYLRDKTRLFA